MPQARPTAASRKLLEQYHFLAENLRDLEEDLRWGLVDSDRIPQEWHRIAQTPGVPFKKALTLRLDVDVVAFFKAMGRGHLTRMNDVLRAFMQARLAGVVKGPEDVDYKPTPLETYLVDTAELIQHMSRRDGRRGGTSWPMTWKQTAGESGSGSWRTRGRSQRSGLSISLFLTVDPIRTQGKLRADRT